jgi:hypothetical protein
MTPFVWFEFLTATAFGLVALGLAAGLVALGYFWAIGWMKRNAAEIETE